MAGKKSGVFCAAVNCSNCRKKCPTMTFHRFPKEERSKQWVINCGRGDLLQRDCEYLWHNCVMCHVHFEDSQVMNPKDPKSRLISGAVPTLFDIPDPSTSLTAKRRVLRRKVEEPSRKKLKTKNVKIKDKPTTSVEKELGSGCDVALKIEERRIKEELTEPELEPAGLVEADSLTTPCLSAGKQPYTVEERTMSPVLITPELLLMHPEADGEKTAAMKEEKPGDDGSYSVFVKAEEMEIKEELMAPELDPLFVEGRTGKERTAPHSLSISAELKELPNVGGVKRENQLEGKDVMKRWTNVRDCYAKFNKKTKKAKKSGAGACKVKSYIYSKELQFLSKLYEERDTQDSFDGPGTCEEEHDGGASSYPLPSQKSSSGASDVGRKRSHKLDPFEEQMLKIMEDDAKNRHMSFFRSVLPSLEKFDDDEVLKFQMDVLQSISKIKEGKLRKTTTHNVHMFSPSGGSPYPTFWQHQSYPPHTSLPPPAPHHHSQTSRFPNAAQPGHVSGDFQGYEQQMSSSYADNAVSPTPTQFSNDSIDFTS